MNSTIFRAATRIVFGLILVFSVYILFRGHNEPGGGFIGALVASAGFAMLKFSFGTEMVRRTVMINPTYFIILGLATAVLSGAFALIYGLPFLTGIWYPAYVAGESEWPISSVLFFDIGVYFTVLGTLLTLLITLEDDIGWRL